MRHVDAGDRGQVRGEPAPPAAAAVVVFAHPCGKVSAETVLEELVLATGLSHERESVIDRYARQALWRKSLTTPWVFVRYVDAGRVRRDHDPMTVQETGSWRPTDSLANRLYLVRREKRLSQRAAADLCGITFGEWQSIEDGRSARGLDEKVLAIARNLDVDRDWLMWGGPLNSSGGPPSPGTGTTRRSPERKSPSVMAFRRKHRRTGTVPQVGDKIPA